MCTTVKTQLTSHASSNISWRYAIVGHMCSYASTVVYKAVKFSTGAGQFTAAHGVHIVSPHRFFPTLKADVKSKWDALFILHYQTNKFMSLALFNNYISLSRKRCKPMLTIKINSVQRDNAINHFRQETIQRSLRI